MANSVQVAIRNGPGVHIHGAQAVRVRTAGEVTVIFLPEADDEPGILERWQRGTCGRRRRRYPDGIRYAGTAEFVARADGVPPVEGAVATVGGAALGGTAGGLRWCEQGPRRGVYGYQALQTYRDRKTHASWKFAPAARSSRVAVKRACASVEVAVLGRAARILHIG